MTDTYIEEKLIEAFLTLNDFSGEEYIIKDDRENLLNVALPNIPFTPPKDNQFYILSFLPNEPEPAGLGTNAENRWSGIFQIDIIVPLGSGNDEITDRYNSIVELFQRGKTFDGVMIIRTYRAMQGADESFYRTVVRSEFTASLPR
jgi:hypothetical protein